MLQQRTLQPRVVHASGQRRAAPDSPSAPPPALKSQLQVAQGATPQSAKEKPTPLGAGSLTPAQTPHNDIVVLQAELKHAREKLESEREQFQNEILKLRAEAEGKRGDEQPSRTDSASQELRETKAKFEALYASNAALQVEFDSARSFVQESMDLNDLLTKKVGKLEALQRTQASKIEDDAAQIISLKNELEATKANLQDEENAVKSALEAKHVASEENGNKCTELDKVLGELNWEKEQHTATEAKLKQAQATITALEQQIKSAIEAENDASKDCGKARADLVNLSDELKLEKEQHRATAAKLARAQATLTTSGEQMKQAKKELEESLHKLADSNEALNEQLVACQGQLDATLASEAALRKKSAQIAQELTSTMQNLSVNQSTAFEIMEDLDATRVELAAAHDHEQELEKQIELMTTRLSRAESAAGNMEAELRSCRQRLDTYEEDLKSLNQTHQLLLDNSIEVQAGHAQQVQVLEQQLHHALSSRDETLRQDLENMHGLAKESNARLEALAEEIIVYKAQLSQKNREFEQSAQDVKDLTKNIELEQRRSKHLEKQASTHEMLRKEMESYKKIIANLSMAKHDVAGMPEAGVATPPPEIGAQEMVLKKEARKSVRSAPPPSAPTWQLDPVTVTAVNDGSLPKKVSNNAVRSAPAPAKPRVVGTAEPAQVTAEVQELINVSGKSQFGVVKKADQQVSTPPGRELSSQVAVVDVAVTDSSAKLKSALNFMEKFCAAEETATKQASSSPHTPRSGSTRERITLEEARRRGMDVSHFLVSSKTALVASTIGDESSPLAAARQSLLPGHLSLRSSFDAASLREGGKSTADVEGILRDTDAFSSTSSPSLTTLFSRVGSKSGTSTHVLAC